MKKISIIQIITFVIFSTSFCQTLHIPLDRLSTLENPTDHIEVFSKMPFKAVKLPVIKDTSKALFTRVFYSWKVTNQPDIVVMLIPKQNGEELYIDKNNNQDFTDDGPVEFFSSDSNNYDFTINSTNDDKQNVKLRFYRKPDNWNYPDSIKNRFIDSLGNLNPNFANFWKMSINKFDFTGKKGDFYWDDRVTLRSGEFVLDNAKYKIGLFDLSNNGLYDDSDDVLIINSDQNGKLNLDDPTKVFKLNDVVTLKPKSFRIKQLDKYGSWVDLEETSQKPTFFYLKQTDSIFNKISYSTIDTSWKNIKVQTINGNTLDFKSFAGKYVLLNFWGEWCKPCINEIPSLVNAFKKIPSSKIQFVSFIQTKDIGEAKKVIKASNISWPQIILTDELETKFKIRSYPTNILILPDGRNIINAGSITEYFFVNNIK